MNIITIAEIKRGGMAALNNALNMPQQSGTATIMKRNRPAAIVLTPLAYEALLRKCDASKAQHTALDWLLAASATGIVEPNVAGLDASKMAQRLDDLGAQWPAR